MNVFMILDDPAMEEKALATDNVALPIEPVDPDVPVDDKVAPVLPVAKRLLQPRINNGVTR